MKLHRIILIAAPVALLPFSAAAHSAGIECEGDKVVAFGYEYHEGGTYSVDGGAPVAFERQFEIVLSGDVAHRLVVKAPDFPKFTGSAGPCVEQTTTTTQPATTTTQPTTTTTTPAPTTTVAAAPTTTLTEVLVTSVAEPEPTNPAPVAQQEEPAPAGGAEPAEEAAELPATGRTSAGMVLTAALTLLAGAAAWLFSRRRATT